MIKETSLFDHYNHCKICNRILPSEYEFEMCPYCIESELFREVKSYIREKKVTEYDVAQHFDLPLRRVKAWIREGRIEYTQDESKTSLGRHCARCGEIVALGELCPTCKMILKRQETKIGFGKDAVLENGKMRFIDSEDKK